jgi:MYXO-CTERM domain-containing protein
VDCPADTNTNGTSCSDGVACNGAEMCMSGACASGTAPTCDDSDVCTADMCGEPAGCAHAHIAGCCNVAADCDDGLNCTADSCSGAGGTCSHMNIPGCMPFDAGMPDTGPIAGDAGRDAGRDGSVVVDAAADAGDTGTVTPAASNCGCAAAGASSGSAAAPFALLGLALVAARRRLRR